MAKKFKWHKPVVIKFVTDRTRMQSPATPPKMHQLLGLVFFCFPGKVNITFQFGVMALKKLSIFYVIYLTRKNINNSV
jgi:hypothetical protein